LILWYTRWTIQNLFASYTINVPKFGHMSSLFRSTMSSEFRKPTLVRSKTSYSLTELDFSNDNSEVFLTPTYKSTVISIRRRAQNSSICTFVHYQRQRGISIQIAIHLPT